jgi:hypothetical protein
MLVIKESQKYPCGPGGAFSVDYLASYLIVRFVPVPLQSAYVALGRSSSGFRFELVQVDCWELGAQRVRLLGLPFHNTLLTNPKYQ